MPLSLQSDALVGRVAELGSLGDGETLVPTIRCTGKLGKEIGVKVGEVGTTTLFDWHATLIWLDRKKHVLFCSDASRLSCLTPVVSRTEIHDLPGLLKAALRRVLEDECIPQAAIGRVLEAHDPLGLAKSRDASLLDTLNDNMQRVRFSIRRSGSLTAAGLAAAQHHLNHMPMEPLQWEYAIDVFKEKVVGATVA